MENKINLGKSGGEVDEALRNDIIKYAKTPLGTIALSPSIVAAIQDVINFSMGPGAKKIMGLIDDTKIAKEITTYDDFIKAASRKGGLSNESWGQLFTGMLKSKNTNAELLNLSTKELVKNNAFIRKYGQITNELELRNILKQRGYTEPAIDQITLLVKNNKNFSLGGVAQQGAKEIEKTINTNAYQEAIKKLNNIKGKLSKSWLTKAGFVGGTITAGVLLSKYLSRNKCFVDIMNRRNSTITPMSNGSQAVYIKNTGNEEYDSKGGLFFFDNGRVMLGNKVKMGSYRCNGNQVSVNEQTSNAPNTDGIGGITITWDGQQTGGGTVSKPKPKPKTTSKYHMCNNFPFEYGCKSDTIRQVQVLLNMPAKYQTGNFGPITLNKLKESVTSGKISSGHAMAISEQPPKITTEIFQDLSIKTSGVTQTPGVTQTYQGDQIPGSQEDKIGGNYDPNVKYINPTGDAYTPQNNQSSINPSSDDGEPLNESSENLIKEDVEKIKDFMKRLIK